jgi:O-6-methylguanine DNA methyltransferase
MKRNHAMHPRALKKPISTGKQTQRILISLPASTTAGEFLAFYSEHGLARLEFPPHSAEAFNSKTKTDPSNVPLPSAIRLWHEQTSRALEAALSGQPVETFPPLDLHGTEFQRRVWSALRQIPPGATIGYAELAARIGSPKAVRAAGGACGANPVPVLVPCHRVLAASRKLGGFSGGLDWKRKLLSAEGIALKLRL